MYNDVPPAIYRLKLFNYWTRNVDVGGVRKPTLLLEFVITDSHHAGVIVPRWYNVEELLGKPRRWGKFRAKSINDSRSRYAHDFRQITGRDRLRATRMSPAAFKQPALEGHVVNGKKGPKLAAVWNPNKPGARGACTRSAQRMHTTYTEVAPKMHRGMTQSDAPNSTMDQSNPPANAAFVADAPDDDLRASDLREQDVGEKENHVIRECGEGDASGLSTNLIEENNNIRRDYLDNAPPLGVGATLWHFSDTEEREWISDYAAHDDTNRDYVPGADDE